jgi:hypothetical protein
MIYDAYCYRDVVGLNYTDGDNLLNGEKKQ